MLEYFVLDGTARSAADLLGINPNSAALFDRKIRTCIHIRLSSVWRCEMVTIAAADEVEIS